VQVPSLAVYLPAEMDSTDMAVIVCPGGAYKNLAYDSEGLDIASWLNTKGIAAFVLKYRLPHSKSVIVGHEAPIQDAMRAIRTVRYNAEKWNISKNKIGMIGFSAAGHLVSTVGTHFNDNKTSSTSVIDSVSARPDFMALIYPLITMRDPYTHESSRTNLLGENPNPKLIDYYSNELHVTKDTPPTFLVHSSDDPGVPVENSLMFYEALHKENVYSEMHIYPTGGHGFCLAIRKGHLQTWPDRLYDWILSLETK
jgi:acetyl esterase/lipase